MKWIKNISLLIRSWFTKSEPYILITDLKDITLTDFITAHCEDDLTVIIVAGNPSIGELKKGWDKLYQDYIRSIGGVEFSNRLQTVKDYAILEGKVRRARMLLELAQVPQAHETIAKMISKFGYPISGATKDNLHIVLKQFQGYLKTDMVRLEGLVNDLEKLSEKADKTPKSDYYYSMIVAIAETLKVQINPNDTSMKLYCSYINQYNRHVKELIKMQKK